MTGHMGSARKCCANGKGAAQRTLACRPCAALRPQLTAFFTSAPILASSAAVNSFSAKAVGHMAPSSRFALSLKPSVAYLVLNFCAVWKKQTTLPSLPAVAYAGIPYQSLGERAGGLSLMIAWSRLAMVRSGSGISAIFASTAASPSPLSALSSWMRSFIAPCSSSVNPLNFFLVLLADFCAGFMKFYSSSEVNYFSRVHSLRFSGKVFNSSGKRDEARLLFLQALELAVKSKDDFNAVDAAHMMAIVEPPEKQLEWNLKALDVAENSADEKARKWRGGLYNNLGWTYFEQKQYEESLLMFEKAMEFREKEGDLGKIMIARWCVGKTLRMMDHTEEALEMQRNLFEQYQAAGKKSGYVYEEIA